MEYSVEYLDKILPPLRLVARTGPVVMPDAISDDDQELLERMFLADRRAAEVWADNVEHDSDPSLTDWPLLRSVLRATGLDIERAERLLYQSPRAKTRADRWSEQRKGYVDFLEYELQRAVDRWAQDELNPTTWPALGVNAGTPGPRNGTCSDHCHQHTLRIQELEHDLQELRQREAKRAALFRVPHKRLSPSGKLLANALLNEQASRESRGETGPIPIIIQAERTPEREDWPDTTLSGIVGLSASTVSRELERLTGTDGLWRKETEPRITVDGKRRGSKLYLVPSAPVDELWAHAIVLEPSPAKKTIPLVSSPKVWACKRHPMAVVDRTTRCQCSMCGRDTMPIIRERFDPTDFEPPPITDPLVTGDALPGPSQPNRQNDGPVQPPLLSVGNVLIGRQNDGPVVTPDLARLYARAGQPAIPEFAKHACHACGAFDDERYGRVVQVGKVYLHSSPDAPCRLPVSP